MLLEAKMKFKLKRVPDQSINMKIGMNTNKKEKMSKNQVVKNLLAIAMVVPNQIVTEIL